MTETGCHVFECPGPDDLPDAARRLFGQNAYATPSWYRIVIATGIPPGETVSFHCVARGETLLGVFPMRRSAAGLCALTTPYTVLWSPLLAPDLDSGTIAAIGQALARHWRGVAVARLEALDPEAAWLAPFLRGVRRAGLMPLRFDHFGNWHEAVAGQGWEAYLASRKGALRSSIKRHGKRLMGMPGAVFTLVQGADDLDAGLDAYARVYDASWKTPEPYPHFNPALMRAAAEAGCLRLGVLRLAGEPIAAQFWLLHQGWAGVQKLAHVEAHKHLAPGTVLTGLMVRQLLDIDHVCDLDFGRGDDAYKQLWVGERRQRGGVLLATPWRQAGVTAIAQHTLSQARRVWRRHAFGLPNAAEPLSGM